MNPTFAEYTTSVAFALTLSKNQCNTLLRVERDYDPIATPGNTRLWMVQVGTLKGLEAKGFVFWKCDDTGNARSFGGLTRAGSLMCALLAEAGLTIENTNSTSMLKRLGHKSQENA